MQYKSRSNQHVDERNAAPVEDQPTTESKAESTRLFDVKPGLRRTFRTEIAVATAFNFLPFSIPPPPLFLFRFPLLSGQLLSFSLSPFMFLLFRLQRLLLSLFPTAVILNFPLSKVLLLPKSFPL